MDKTQGNYVRLSDSYFPQDAPSAGPPRFVNVTGGILFL